jgi:hypothetical protein
MNKKLNNHVIAIDANGNEIRMFFKITTLLKDKSTRVFLDFLKYLKKEINGKRIL